jgi:serpin B
MSRPFAPRSLFALTSAAALAALLPACGSDDGDGTGAGPDDGPSGGAVTPPDDTPPADTSEAKSNLERDLAPAPSDDALKALTDGQAAFALDLYGPLGAEGGNVFYSPLSIHQALTMAFAGAAGTTAAEMAAVLHLGDEPHVAQNALDLSLAAAAQAPVEGEGSPLALEIANAMWGSPRLRWEQAFLDTLALNYGAGLRLTDFAADPEAARVAINDWVEDKTNDRIQKLLTPGIITPETVMVLVNAIFFKASWDTPFEPEATQDADFHLLDGTTAPVPMMRQQLGALAGAGEGWQAVELPYKGGRATMLLVVPDDLAAFEEHLDEGLYAEILGSLRGGGGTVELPRFEFTASALLGKTLKGLGMIAPFESADFSGMTRDDVLTISEVVHKAFVKVDEEGTEAAAATAVVLAGTTADVEPPPPFHVRADRPFVFFIRDAQTGAVLFTGRVADPRG